MTKNEIILEYLKTQRDIVLTYRDNASPYLYFLKLLIQEQEEWCKFYNNTPRPTTKGYTSDDFAAMSDEIKQLSEQVKHLQELCQTFIKLDSGGTSFLTVPFEGKKFSKLWVQISEDLQNNP